MNPTAIFLGLSANFCFSLASQIFTYYSRKISVNFVNEFKALVAFACFVLYVALNTFISGQSFPTLPNLTLITLLMTSGFLGLGVGDIFLLQAYSRIGPGRTLMLFGFQPLVIGFASFLLFDQYLNQTKFYAILSFMCCVGIFSLESFKRSGHWEVRGLVMALLGVFFDAAGVLMSRWCFNQDANLSPFMANMWRCLGALLYFRLYALKMGKTTPIAIWGALPKKDRLLMILAPVLGAFLSLTLYYKALQFAHLATLSGLAITGTVLSAVFECALEKKWPSRYLIGAFAFFLIGMAILLD
jgi:drug/metabolite transporter (DMT)-like permease